MKKYFGILMALLLTGVSFGQDDKAKAILDKVSSKTDSYKSVIIDFTLTITGDGITNPIKETGKAYLDGDKYKVELKDQDIYCDGKTITTHLKEDQECYTSSVEDSKEEGAMVSPSELLTIWEDGYKYKYAKETTYKGKAAHVINLYPKNPSSSKFHTIILTIDKEKSEIMSVYIKGKEGTNMKYELTKIQKNATIASSTFVFNRAKHPDVECYDE